MNNKRKIKKKTKQNNKIKNERPPIDFTEIKHTCAYAHKDYKYEQLHGKN
jgi:hypothetical protein